MNRAMLKTILLLAWPAMVEQALQTVVQYADSAMVGHIGVQATAAVGLTSTVTWLTNSPIWAMGTGVLAVIARSVGAKDERKTRSAAQMGIWIALIMGAIMLLITECIAPFLPKWLGADPAIHRNGSLYYAIICAPMIFRALSMVMGSALRASGNTRTPMRVNLGMNAINVVLNFFLIFPSRRSSLFGVSLWIPGAGWGVIGAAIATAVSVTFSGSMMLCKVLRSPVLSPRGLKTRWDAPVLRECVRIGLPVALQNIGVFTGHVVFSAQVTSLGTTALATHSIALTAEQAFYIPGYGMQAAASTLCGIALGERNEDKLDRTSRMSLLLSMGMMVLTGGFLFAFPALMMSIFTKDPLVIAGGAVVLRIVACSEPLYAAMIIFEGIFHGVGQTRYPFVVSLITMWGVRILGTIICVRAFHLGLPAVWLCMVGDNVSRAALLGVRYFSGRWKRTLGLTAVND
ncbi:MAG: MATE family efflux transporter [Clostridia bacterium]|nr:MATE family efflux transporter [Clostridia bacterium]